MGFMDKVKETAGKGTEMAKGAAKAGQDKLEEQKTKKKISELKEELGSVVYAEDGHRRRQRRRRDRAARERAQRSRSGARDDRRRGGGRRHPRRRPACRRGPRGRLRLTAFGAACITAVTLGTFPSTGQTPLQRDREGEGGWTMRSNAPRARRFRRASVTLVVIAIAAVRLTSTVGGEAPESGGKADPNGILKFATDLQVSGIDKGLDPIKSRSVGDFVQMNLIYDTLFHAQDDGTYKPGLALSYEVEGDNTVTFKLRPNLKFSDGSPLDANAVKFSIDRAVAAKNPNLAPEINNVGSVDVIDATTVKITMKTPTIGSFFELLAGRETMPVHRPR